MKFSSIFITKNAMLVLFAKVIDTDNLFVQCLLYFYISLLLTVTEMNVEYFRRLSLFLRLKQFGVGLF